MAKLEIPIHVYMDELEEIINELKHLQTYKLFEGDDMVLIDCDKAVEIFANHLRAEIRDTQTIKPAQQWIPVIERLPEKDGTYIVGGKWSSGKEAVGECVYHVHDGYFDAVWNFDVIAWVPLPEPYKGEQDG